MSGLTVTIVRSWFDVAIIDAWRRFSHFTHEVLWERHESFFSPTPVDSCVDGFRWLFLGNRSRRNEKCWIQRKLFFYYSALSTSDVKYTNIDSVDGYLTPGWWPVMIQDEILVAEQPLTRQLKWSNDLQQSILAYFTQSDGAVEYSDCFSAEG